MRLILMIDNQGQFHRYMTELTTALQNWSGCEAVGIRLKDGDDFPYFETRVFPLNFIKIENSLCRYAADGTPELECMCGNILSRRIDASRPFFTIKGSFWSNNTTGLLASTSDSDRLTHTRNF
jgi:hypothetical protein